MLPRKNLFSFTSKDPSAFGIHLAAAAREHSVYFDEGLGVPVVLRGADVAAVLRDSETFSTRAYDTGIMKGTLVTLGGESHTRMRRLFNAVLSPRVISRYEEATVTPVARRVVERLVRKERADLFDDFAMSMPMGVTSALFGLPEERIAENDVLIRKMIRSVVMPQDPVVVAEGRSAHAAMEAQLREIAEREVAHPSDTLLGEIARAIVAEGLGGVEACEGVVLTLILASYETTSWMLANLLVALLAHPDAMNQLRQQPSLLPQAIEESTRWCNSAAGIVRFVEREATIGGETLAAGTILYLSLIARHYDEEIYPRPETFDIHRRPVGMLNFGGGPHYCVGAPLARMEARIGVSLLLERFPALRADPTVQPTFSTAPRGAAAFGPDQIPALLV
ncbi:cytochrome P450 [Sorangium sp. So ce426]|uniref:cytochrome P450 n=1 Tax=Sorangium sp. So ce426 TaxID=3133312 RepID=UPI003F5B7F88